MPQYILSYDLNGYHTEVKNLCTSFRGDRLPFTDFVVSGEKAIKLPNTTLAGRYDSAAIAARTFQALAKEAAPNVVVKKLCVSLWADGHMESDEILNVGRQG